jgi:hypothetical protein
MIREWCLITILLSHFWCLSSIVVFQWCAARGHQKAWRSILRGATKGTGSYSCSEQTDAELPQRPAAAAAAPCRFITAHTTTVEFHDQLWSHAFTQETKRRSSKSSAWSLTLQLSMGRCTSWSLTISAIHSIVPHAQTCRYCTSDQGAPSKYKWIVQQLLLNPLPDLHGLYDPMSQARIAAAVVNLIIFVYWDLIINPEIHMYIAHVPECINMLLNNQFLDLFVRSFCNVIPESRSCAASWFISNICCNLARIITELAVATITPLVLAANLLSSSCCSRKSCDSRSSIFSTFQLISISQIAKKLCPKLDAASLQH